MDNIITSSILLAMTTRNTIGYRMIYQRGDDGTIRVAEPYTYETLELVREDYVKAGHSVLLVITDEEYQRKQARKG